MANKSAESDDKSTKEGIRGEERDFKRPHLVFHELSVVFGWSGLASRHDSMIGLPSSFLCNTQPIKFNRPTIFTEPAGLVFARDRHRRAAIFEVASRVFLIWLVN